MSFAWPRGIRSGVIGRSPAAKRLKQRSKQHLIEALEPRHLMAVAAVPNQPLRVAAQPIAIESGLIDSDPAIDLVTLNSAGTLSVALNGADGSWRSLRDDDLGLGQAYGMTAGALDGNPSLDLVVIGATTARVLIGDGNGGFTLGDTLRAPSGGRWRPTEFAFSFQSQSSNARHRAITLSRILTPGRSMSSARTVKMIEGWMTIVACH